MQGAPSHTSSVTTATVEGSDTDTANTVPVGSASGLQGQEVDQEVDSGADDAEATVRALLWLSLAF
jgi:hypothetical protein